MMSLSNAQSAWLGQAIRFTLVSGTGVLVDLGLGAICRSLLRLDLHLSATVGFTAACALNYFLHRRWTFQGTKNRRAISYVITCLLTLAIRYTVITLFQYLPLPEVLRNGVPTLMAAVGVSFTVNFLVCRAWVFRQRPDFSTTN